MAAKHRSDTENRRKSLMQTLEKRKLEEKYNALIEERNITKQR